MGIVQAVLGLAFVVLVLPATPSTSSAQETSRRLDSARAAKLHDLANDILPARSVARSRRADEGRRLLAALNMLSQSISDMEEGPSQSRLSTLEDRRRGAETALTRLRESMTSLGASESADEFERLFAPLWSEIDGALAATSGERSEKLSAAQAYLAKARSSAANAHGTGFMAHPLGADR
jgi:hypothetical protein